MAQLLRTDTVSLTVRTRELEDPLRVALWQISTLYAERQLTPMFACGQWRNDPKFEHTLDGQPLEPGATHPPSQPDQGRLGWPPEEWHMWRQVNNAIRVNRMRE
jgi:hypothetical protein